ncbi:MAG: ribosome-associated translation inhibitor RaiA [Nitrospirae bacterium]|nr:ribosome-associated translation inhibitor RaiA [Nitrospirota bacterium]MBF0542352.1 ribosome-associated translation inhibitor RaiA [Nitrospirota bacterium]
MNIILNGKHLEITPAIKEYASEKIGRFEKFVKDIEVIVTLSVDKYRHKAEVMIKGKGLSIQAESITSEIYSSIDEVAEKLERQIKKYKEKITTRRKTTKKTAKSDYSESIQDITGKIIERKKFDMKPMHPEEAALQINLTGREFFLFINDSSGDMNVIYKREDGNFALIEPAK